MTDVTTSGLYPDGYYKLGDTIAIQVVFDEPVYVNLGAGTATLTLETGTTDAIVNYSSGSGTNTLVFSYTVAAGEESLDLDYISSAALVLTGGATIQDAVSIDANIVLPTPGAAGSLAANKALIVDGIVPSLTLSTTGGTTNVPYTVTAQFSEDVTGFISGDLVVVNGTVSAFTAVDGDTYTFLVTPTAQ